MTALKKKVLVSINTSWNIFNFRKNLLLHLMDKGMQIIALAPKDAYSQKLIELGIDFYEIPIAQKGTNAFEDISLLFKYRTLIKTLNPDICLFYTIKPNIYGSLAAYSLGIPYINNISGLGTVFIRNRPSSLIAKLLYKFALRHSKHIFFQNEEDAGLFEKTGIIKHKRIEILPGSGIDLNYFKDSKQEPKANKFTFLMVSRLIFDKGIREFIEASSKVKKDFPRVNFEVLGKAEDEANLGYSEAQMKKICSKKGIHWHKSKDDVRPILEKADVVVLPSYREGMSRALIEALSMEKAILTTDVPGCRELVNNNQNGLLCNPTDADDLAQKMTDFINMPEEKIKEMGRKGRLLIKESYSDERIFKSYLNAITDKLS